MYAVVCCYMCIVYIKEFVTVCVLLSTVLPLHSCYNVCGVIFNINFYKCVVCMFIVYKCTCLLGKVKTFIFLALEQYPTQKYLNYYVA